MLDLTKERYHNINYCVRCGNKLHLEQDREGKQRPHCGSCGWVYYKNAVPAVAMIVINDKDELLLIKRKFEPQAGEWALPSGYMEIDMTPEQNAMEELEEETGLTGEVEHFVGWYYEYSPIYERILNLGFRMKVTGGHLMAGDDAVEAAFVPLSKLPKIAFGSHRDFIMKETGNRIRFD